MLTAVARAVATDFDGRTALTTLRSAVPLALRESVDGLTVVGSAFGPLGGDRTRLELLLGPRARLRVGSAAAQVAQPGVHDAVSHAALDLEVGAGAHLHWQPQPLVVGAGAEHRLDVDLRVAAGGTAVVAEVVVLGRRAGEPGRYRSRWRVAHDDRPLLAADLDVGPGAPAGWDGPAVTGGARVLVTVLVVGGDLPDVVVTGGEVLRLAGPGLLLSWLGDDPVAGVRAVGDLLAALPA